MAKRHYKLDSLLSPEDRPAYEALLRQPATTVDEAFAWLEERGVEVSRSAVHRHKRTFEETLSGVRRSAEMAQSFAQVARESGVEGMTEAALARFSQLLMEKLMQIDGDADIDAGELLKLAMSIRQQVGSARDLRKSLAEKFEKEMAKTGEGKKAEEIFTPERIADARRRIFGC